MNLGGHNPLEIAFFRSPVITGPSQFKNNDAIDRLKEAGLITQVTDSAELAAELDTMLKGLAAGKPLLSAPAYRRIRAYRDEACERATKTAHWLLSDLAANKQ